MSKIDARHTLERVLKDHKSWLRQEGGSRAILCHADLQYADLQGVDLRHPNLQHTDLRHANLRHTDLRHANLQGADFQYADFFDTVYQDQIPIIINTEYYNIVKTKDFIEIGCQIHSTDEWRAMTDVEIGKMDVNALVFWEKYKKLVLSEIGE